MKVFMKLIKIWEKDLYFQFSQNIMEWGIGPEDIHIDNLLGLGQWVGYLMEPW